MPAGDDYVEHLVDLLAPVGRVTARKMFGGWGLFLDGNMIGLVYDGRGYLKVDDETRGKFADGEPFVYRAHGKHMEMSYVSPPDEAFDSPAAMSPWAKLAAQAASRAAYGKRSKTKKPGAKPTKQPGKPARSKLSTAASSPGNARGSRARPGA